MTTRFFLPLPPSLHAPLLPTPSLLTRPFQLTTNARDDHTPSRRRLTGLWRAACAAGVLSTLAGCALPPELLPPPEAPPKPQPYVFGTPIPRPAKPTQDAAPATPQSTGQTVANASAKTNTGTSTTSNPPVKPAAPVTTATPTLPLARPAATGTASAAANTASRGGANPAALSPSSGVSIVGPNSTTAPAARPSVTPDKPASTRPTIATSPKVTEPVSAAVPTGPSVPLPTTPAASTATAPSASVAASATATPATTASNPDVAAAPTAALATPATKTGDTNKSGPLPTANVDSAKPAPADDKADKPATPAAPTPSAKAEDRGDGPDATRPDGSDGASNGQASAESNAPKPVELRTRVVAKVEPPPWNYRPPVVLAPPPPPQMPEPVTVRASQLIACEARRTLQEEEQRTSITCRNGSRMRQTVYLRIQASNVAGLPTPEAERAGHVLNPGETRTLVNLAIVAQPAQVAFSYSHQPRP